MDACVECCTISTKCSRHASQMVLNWTLMVLSQVTTASEHLALDASHINLNQIIVKKIVKKL